MQIGLRLAMNVNRLRILYRYIVYLLDWPPPSFIVCIYQAIDMRFFELREREKEKNDKPI